MFIVFAKYGSIEIVKGDNCFFVFGSRNALEYLVEKEEYHLIEDTDNLELPRNIQQYFDSVIKLPESYVAFRLSELVLSIE